MQILFVGTSRHGPNLIRSFNLKPLLHSPPWHPAGYPNITVTRPLRLGIDSTPSGHRFNQRLYRRHVASLTRRLGLLNPILWINAHDAWHLPATISHGPLIYDITDDWTTLSQKDLDRQRTIAADRRLCQSADAVIVCSEKLQQLKAPLVPPSRLHLIPNGVDSGHYAAVLQPGPIPAALAKLPRPIFGYTGTIHPDRVDLGLLAALARALPSASFVLVGPSHLLPPHHAALSPPNTPGNIHILPAVPYAQIPEVMRGFDVCMTSHKMTPFTESLNPIKLWEYLAAGKPIVSTDVAGFRDYPQHVRLAKTAETFAAALMEAAAEGPAKAPARQAEARHHSWESRVDQIESVIAACFNGSPEAVANVS